MSALVRAVVAVLLLTLGVGCASQPAQPATSSPAQPDVPPPLVPAMALPQNAVDNAVAKLDDLAEGLMAKSGIPGLAVAVVHEGKTVYAKGFGVKDVGETTESNRVDPDTVFQLASLSKPLAATVVAHQVGVGAVDWNTPIVSKLPWFTLSDPTVTRMVTVGDMLAHRSGLPDHAGDKLEDIGYDRRQVLERLGQLPLDPFRISYAYTNFGFTAGAEAVAVGAGKPWEQLAEDVLFEPLGMSSTSYRFADYQDRPNRAVGHIRVDGRYQPTYVRDADPEAPAGGASASANDMTRWLAMVLANGSHDGKQIVDPKALLPALTPQIVSARATEPAMRSGFYGYGFNVSSTSGARMELSHSGAFLLGAGTNFVILPSADVAIVALTNGSPSGVPETLTAEFADLVQFGEVREDWYRLYSKALGEMDEPEGSLAGKQPPADPAPAAPLPSYTGVYHNDYWGAATITEADGELRLRLGTKLAARLSHWDGNTFTYRWVSENSPPGSVSKVTFDGDTLIIEDYDEFGKGAFRR
ncbi:serine hydrolase [Mycolicibacterium holsaticum]|uniref:Serine hydrolase n=1 Tax=Mycolicibacterium holsaticum TaxID=152142 RepID=A0A1E3S3G8_9MYCO|nr:serine hydrolase [Mycolicibacterium holsaticum]ODQ96658.1 serine hydrolase [Mycolicibacterium holsaticum]